MVNAARRFREVLEEVSFKPLEVDVLSNYTGRMHESDAGAVRSRLFFQLFNQARFTKSWWRLSKVFLGAQLFELDCVPFINLGQQAITIVVLGVVLR